MIAVHELTKTYCSRKGTVVSALRLPEVTFPDTGFVSVVGKSGCGKTTLLNMIGALDTADSGSVEISFADNGYRKNIAVCPETECNEYRNLYLGCVFQDYFLIEEWTVYQNLELVLEQQKHEENKEEIRRRIGEILEFVDLKGYDNRYVKELSGGQQQRVAIARALIKSPRILVADEPTGNLDYENSRIILELLKKASSNCLVLMVTHDLEAAEEYADRLLKLRDGCIIFDETRGEDRTHGTAFKPVGTAGGLPARVILPLAFESLRIKKARLILSAISLILLFGVCLIFLRYRYTSLGKALDKLLDCSGESFLYWEESLEENQPVGEMNYSSGNTDRLRSELPRLFGKENCCYVQEDMELKTSGDGESSGFLVIAGVKDPNYDFYGRLPAEENEIAITDAQCRELGLSGDGIGETVYVNGIAFVVCGVTVTGFTGDFSDTKDKWEVRWNTYMQNRISRRMLVSEKYRDLLEGAESLRFSGVNPIASLSAVYADEISTVTGVTAATAELAEAVDGRMPAADYEIAVSLKYALENSMLDSEGRLVDYDYGFADLHNEVYEGLYDGVVSMYDYLPYIEVVGVVDLGDSETDLIVTDRKFNEIKADYLANRCFDSIEVCLAGNKNADRAAYQKLYTERIFSTNCFASYLYSAYENNRIYRNLYMLGVAMISVLLILLSVLFFFFNVRDNHRKIGILRAVGVAERDVAKMFFVEAGLAVGFVIILSVISETLFFYRKYSGFDLIPFALFPENVEVTVLACISLAAVVFLAAFLPMWIMAKSRPVELIRMD